VSKADWLTAAVILGVFLILFWIFFAELLSRLGSQP
jgi:hypothetical protein